MSWDFLTSALQLGGNALLPGLGSAIGVGANLLGASEATRAQQAAAQARAQAIQQEQAQLGQIAQDNQGGQDYEKKVVAGSASLTPEQQLQLEDLRRGVGNQIRGSSIAGSGRTAASLLRDSESRFTLGALGQNRARADNAAGAMAGRAYGASTASARANEGIGAAYGDAAANSGLINASATMANGRLIGGAFGDVSSNIARSNRSSMLRQDSNYGGSPESNPNLNPASYGNISGGY